MKLKRIKFNKLKNTRDLGGFAAANGKFIKQKSLIRSGSLAKASGEDIKKLCNEYNLGTIIDLRIEAEIKDKPYEIPESVNYYNILLLDKSYLGIARDEYSLMSWFNLFADTDRTPEDVFSEMYEMLVFSERSAMLIPQIFDILLNNDDKSVLWHCSAGKDRVGVVTMLVLYALGVEKELILKDFMATNRFSAAEIYKTKIFAPLVIKNRRQRKCLSVLMGVKRMYLERVFDRIESEFSGTEDFFFKQFGILPEQIEQLRNKYLTDKGI